jgi:hypothetical protein
MSTQAADAWLILNDADAVETKMLATMNRVFADQGNRDMFMGQMVQTSSLHAALMNVTGGFQMQQNIYDILRRTLESAEVMIQQDMHTYTPRIAVRFSTPSQGSFVVYPKVIQA